MNPDAISTEQATTRLRRRIDTLRARTAIQWDTQRLRTGDLRTLAAHERQARDERDGRKTVANRVWGHGRGAEILGYLDLDDYAILGLEANSLVHALWIAEAAAENPVGSRGDLLRVIFAEPERLSWCRAEGARVAWHFSKAARNAETAAFKQRQARGGVPHWRKEPVTARQNHLMEIISVRGHFPVPAGLRRGTAYDWIALNGAHPNFWAPPSHVPGWS